MDHTLDAVDPYLAIVDKHAEAFNFLMPQYYNGGMSPFEPAGLAAIEQNYRARRRSVRRRRVAPDLRLLLEPSCAPLASQPAALEVTKNV